MKAGLLISQFSTEAGLGSGLIRYLSDGDYSHVDLVVPKGIALQHGKPILSRYGLLGARTDGGVQLRPPNYAKFTRALVVGCEVPDIHAAYSFAFAQLGKPYDRRAILDFFLHRERKFTPDQPAWFCDGLNYTVFMQGGKLLLDTTNPFNLTPQGESLSPYWKTQQAL